MEKNIQPLDPIAISLGPIQVHWYGLIIGVGIALALIIAMREGERRGLPKDIFADLMLWAIPIAIISARIYYVIFQWDFYSQNPGEIIKIWNGGIAIHGALIGSVITAYVFAKKRKISFWKLADIAAPSIILGQAIGRWGNFMNQEAHGREVSRAFLENMYLPEFIVDQMYINGAYYHPTFLYESIWNIIGFIILILLRRANLRRGELFLSYVIWYSIGRFFVEGLRTDSLMLTENLRIAQTISIVLIIGALVLIFYRRAEGLAKARYLDKAEGK
ncbi:MULTISPECIES: prolipoprotein diacylglyceryl transferase [Cytobacillus]|jgi:phosphatidylglycerol---prolipoprotein diacylglyceryl transferase|uniref:Phosphatidylglycerol--prolipoprotein diacylglyceryl transferase n=3 Tax=Cytobacillus TaxID=2675230 RepID=A0A160MGL5_9BACI|nr:MULTISPECIES: prolipoprotein diacylglyceryl transferase [Cytobacillus]EFV78427.1 prolipoprotein diacylglyceryl transferase [Bacillus sp. 2_A_57_CT2]MCS0826357.1 prolipoprotein diacylglyceryl transferase [Cytobacillus firmus]AND42154.1 prolipoprotein diacylglyceryl transferase [Cytobacillus oceanisediminis 2691]MCM3244302.1 prolipoprotein diacylglyceryl transferase [Cytobacillus oceanisediminis]MCM3401936.1 prolipoprotein diacylglyceryl transferase [Cytobacillus oceanisediminis]